MHNREIYWLGRITEEQTQAYINAILTLYHEDPKEEIVLWVNNTGGSLVLAFSFLDFIKAKNINLTTIGSGHVYSGGVLLMASGSKRLATENCFFGVHPPYRQFSQDDVLDPNECEQIKNELLESRDYICKVLATICGTDLKVIQKIYEFNTEFDSKKAKKLGLIHKVIKTVKPPPK